MVSNYTIIIATTDGIPVRLTDGGAVYCNAAYVELGSAHAKPDAYVASYPSNVTAEAQDHLIAQSGYIPETEVTGWIQSQGYEPYSPPEEI
jgi:hypothetical protein